MRFKDIFILYIYFLILAIGLSYFYVIGFQEEINLNWGDYRCKPYVMPFAAFIKKDIPKDAITFSFENFEDCMIKTLTPTIANNINEQIGPSLNAMNGVIKTGTDGVQSVYRVYVNMVRRLFAATMNIIIGMFGSSITSFSKVIITVQTLSKKIVGLTTTLMYTMISGLKLQESIFEYMKQVTKTIGNIALGISFIFPPAAALFHMIKKETRGFIRFCFHPQSVIKLKENAKAAKHIKCGDVLEDGNVITHTFILKSQSKPMVRLGNIICTHDHLVMNDGGVFVNASQHKYADSTTLESDYLVCWRTETGRFKQGSITFADYEDGIPQTGIGFDNKEGLISTVYIPTWNSQDRIEWKPVNQIRLNDVVGFNKCVVCGIVKQLYDDEYDLNPTKVYGKATKIHKSKESPTFLKVKEEKDCYLYSFITNTKVINCGEWGFENYETEYFDNI